MFFIDETICSGCGECQDNCPVGAIEPTDDGLFKIDASVCSDCAACQSACPFEAVQEDPEQISILITIQIQPNLVIPLAEISC